MSKSHWNLSRPLFAVLCFCAMSIFLIDAEVPLSVDGELYLGVGEHLIATGSYADVVRHDEILPSVGHVLYATLLGRINPLIPYLAALMGFAVAIAYIAPRGFIYQTAALVCCIVFSKFIAQHLTVGGVESSLILSASLLVLGTITFITNPSKASIVAWSLSVFWMLLVRPVYLPMLLPMAVSAGVYAYCAGMRGWSGLSAVPVALWIGVWGLSYFEYSDGRLVTGTYSSIPLYSGFNKHINLERNYGSKLWDSGNSREGLQPIENRDGWQQRDRRLRSLVVDFVLKNPERAIRAYMFRLSRFLLPYKYEPLYTAFMIAGWFGSLLIVILRTWRYSGRWALAALVAFGLNIAWAIASALFVYVGSRYLVANYTMTVLVLTLQFRALGPYQIIAGNER